MNKMNCVSIISIYDITKAVIFKYKERPKHLLHSVRYDSPLESMSEEEDDSLYVRRTPRNVCALSLEVSKWRRTKWQKCFVV